jgi:hypothetical protein
VPNRNCDIVMKGGITSGVVYPLAITELAKEFRFKNVGGTSAGAIAAALTAAAEYARLGGSDAGFARLAKLPRFLAGETGGEPNLLNLFPPTHSTRRLFAVLAAFLTNESRGAQVIAALSALVLVSPLLSIISFVPAALALLLLRELMAPPAIAAFIVAEIALVILGFVILIAGNAVRALTVTLPRNRFGFSTGLAPSDRRLPGVSEWLHAEIQATAGRAMNDPPLTFGDLWLAGGGANDLEECERDPEKRAINLQMITTALSHGHPYRLPFENRRFAFRPSELRQYFPAEVVAFMVSRARAEEDVSAMNDPDLVALPEPWDLPVVVAARMSLSFPILFSLVPLYAVDYTLAVNAAGARQFDRCWFIDGGLSSNFPLSLFDSAIPRWPTFGINLDGFHPDHPKDPAHERNNVWIPNRPGSGLSDHWLRFGGIGGYVGAILDSIRNWHDNTQMAVPGFRDRVVSVHLTPDEGGLNLNMDATKVSALSERGRWAGVALTEHFGAAATGNLNWNTHRWTRYRSGMALLQDQMRGIARAFAYDDPAYPSYGDLVARNSDANPKTGYWWNRAPAPYQQSTANLVAFAGSFFTTPPDFSDGAPRPRPELRVVPKV